jgi:hypothetical protein
VEEQDIGGQTVIQFKLISREAVPQALEKAERYRLLNEPAQAESICLDVLAVDPDNQQALVMLLLSLTDQFRTGPSECFHQAEDVIPQLREEYDRLYYSGLIWERRGLACAVHGQPGSAPVAYAWIRRAMSFYEQAERLRSPSNDDPLLRWNNCLRLCQRYRLHPEPEVVAEPVVGDD